MFWGLLGLILVGILVYVFVEYLVVFFIFDDEFVIVGGVEFICVMCLIWGGIGV